MAYSPAKHLARKLAAIQSGVTPIPVDDGSVTNVKLAATIVQSIKANATDSLVSPGDLAIGTNALVGRGTGNLQSLALGTNLSITAGVLNASSLGGVSDGDKGDITVSVGGTVWTVDAGAITLAKQADMATGSLVYRKTAAAGAPEVQTLATLKTDLGLTGTNSGDQATIVGITGTLAEFNAALTGADFATGGGTATGANTGDQTSIAGITGTKAQFDTAVSDGNIQYVGDAPTSHTHLLAAGATDVTVTAANLNALDDGVNTALHFHDADRARANHTGTQAASTISDSTLAGRAMLTAATVAAQTALLDAFTSAVKGLAPASGGGTANFLRADGTWSAPASGGGSTLTQVTLTVSPAAIDYKEVVVTDASVTAVSKITANLVPVLDAENDLEGMADDNMRVWPIAEAGQVRFVLTAIGAFVGPFKVNYGVSA